MNDLFQRRVNVDTAFNVLAGEKRRNLNFFLLRRTLSMDENETLGCMELNL